MHESSEFFGSTSSLLLFHIDGWSNQPMASMKSESIWMPRSSVKKELRRGWMMWCSPAEVGDALDGFLNLQPLLRDLVCDLRHVWAASKHGVDFDGFLVLPNCWFFRDLSRITSPIVVGHIPFFWWTIMGLCMFMPTMVILWTMIHQSNSVLNPRYETVG